MDGATIRIITIYIYQDFIITTHHYIVFYIILIIHNFS